MKRRDFLKAIGATSGALALAPAFAGAAPRDRIDTLETRPFFFVHMADPQLGMITGNQGFEIESERYQRAIAHCNRLRPAFVVIGGDLTNAPHDPGQIAEYLRVGKLLDPSIPLRHVAGNHDVQNSPQAQDLVQFRETYGQDWYAFEYGSSLCVVLNSCLMTSPLNLKDEAESQWQWAKALIEKREKDAPGHILVFQHHQIAALDWKEASKYNDLLWEHGGGPIFVGHTHLNGSENYRGIETIITSSVGNPFGSDVPGFRIVKVYPDRIEQAYHSLDAMPAAVELDRDSLAAWLLS